MKAIILAAGKGTRLSKYTKDCPKGLLTFNGMSLIEHQINAMNKIGIDKIVIVKGYLEHKIDFNDITYYYNSHYQETNMVESLFCAESDLNDDCIVTYSDIIYNFQILKETFNCKYNVGVVVDTNFIDYWKARLGNLYYEDMESLIIHNNRITSLGNPKPNINEIFGRYVGIIKFSKKGIQDLIDNYYHFKEKKIRNKLENRVFNKWHMTDLLQGMIDRGYIIRPINISKGWLEFDTDRDYELYNKWLNNGYFKRFIILNNYK